MMTKKIIIRIIVAVVVAFLLSKLKLLGIMQVHASSLSTSFTYNNAQITQNPVIMNFSDSNGFAYGYSFGELRTTILLDHSEFSQNSIDTRGSSLKQAYITLSNDFQAICDVGSPSNPIFYSSEGNGTFNYSNYGSTLYTIKCNVNPTYSGIKTLTLLFNRTSSLTRLSVGPVVTFTENESSKSIKNLQDEIKKQNETCTDSPNLLPNLASSSTVNGLSFSVNSDKSITINGTATTRTYFNINNSQQLINLESGSSYTLSTTSTLPTGIRMTIRKYSVAEDISTVSANSNKVNFISNYTGSSFVYLSIIEGTSFNNFTFYPQLEKGSFSSYVPFGEVQCKNKQDLALEESQKQTQSQQETNDYLKSDDHSEADSDGASFFNDFGGNNHGISGIVTAPLRLLQSLSTASCSPLTFPLPFVNEQISLPCMRGIYQQYFGVFFSLWQLITTGLISYNVSLNIYSKVRAMQNPNNDKIEVLNL